MSAVAYHSSQAADFVDTRRVGPGTCWARGELTLESAWVKDLPSKLGVPPRRAIRALLGLLEYPLAGL